MNVTDVLDITVPFIEVALGDLLKFVIMLVAGVVAVRITVRVLRRTLERLKVPPLIVGLLVSTASVIGYIVVVLVALPIIGVDTSTAGLSLSAILGLILGFGLQDTWANLAAGIWLAVMRPFDKGDVVSVAGYTGVVEGITVMSTVLKTFTNEVITIPNRSVWGSPITNYTREPIRRIDIDVGVAYGTDLDMAINIILEAAKNHELVLNDPPPTVIVTQLADSSIVLQLRAWVKKEDYVTAKSELIKTIYNALNRAGIEIPFPQMDVHIKEMPR